MRMVREMLDRAGVVAEFLTRDRSVIELFAVTLAAYVVMRLTSLMSIW